MASSEELDATVERHLDWSDKQRRILTANDRADSFYTVERGFAFTAQELPHYHLLKSTTHAVFDEWKTQTPKNPIVGAWKRPLFYGGWENSTDQDERVYNVQTHTLFIDLRIPTTKNRLFGAISTSPAQSLQDLTAVELRYYARQHCFAGYSFPSVKTTDDSNNNKPSSLFFDACYARHHCIDWNFCGAGRSRPNKWWVEIEPTTRNLWKEWAFATDDAAQQYYCERWERLPGAAADGPVVALRKSAAAAASSGSEVGDGVIVVVGNHFNYCLSRQGVPCQPPDGTGSLVGLVDAAVENGDLEAARAWLSMQGGHGTISTGWTIDAAIEFWKEGTALWSKSDVIVQGTSIDDCHVLWKGELWDVFECNLATPEDLQALLHVQDDGN
jgi:hypothetical protein